MPPKGWSEEEYRARQERAREWAVLLAYICGHPRAYRALAYLMRRYAPPAGDARKICRYCGRDDSQDENGWAYSTICPYCVADMQAWV